MGYHHNPIEPSDWTHGDDPDESAVLCPHCSSDEVEPSMDANPDTAWRCAQCGWRGPEPTVISPEPYEHEPDMGDFL